jgi:hypothetical protein
MPPITSAELAAPAGVVPDSAKAAEAKTVQQATPALRMVVRTVSPRIFRALMFAAIRRWGKHMGAKPRAPAKNKKF